MRWSFVAIGLLGCTAAQAQHVHGVVQLGVVVEGNVVAVSLEAPLSDVVGFEHAPKNDEQSAAVNRIAEILADADAMFGLPSGANCQASKASLEGPEFITGEAKEGHDDEHGHGHDDDHGHGEEEHSEIHANYEWQCGDAAAIDSMELHFATEFADVQSIEVQVISAAGAKVTTLAPGTASLSMAP